jgi:hypothetical protein
LNTSTGSTGSTYTVGAVKRDDDEHHAVTVLCASDELYTLGQDMCVSCGSFGCSVEGRLISCTQCGQSYHPYCAGLNKVSKSKEQVDMKRIRDIQVHVSKDFLFLSDRTMFIIN